MAILDRASFFWSSMAILALVVGTGVYYALRPSRLAGKGARERSSSPEPEGLTARAPSAGATASGPVSSHGASPPEEILPPRSSTPTNGSVGLDTRGAPTPGATRPRVEQVHRTGEGPHGRVLVVDDEPMVCRAVARTLSDSHEVVAMTDPREALDLLCRGEPFDLVLCDFMMPVVNGMQFHAALRDSRPELARSMVFLTGGSFTRETSLFFESIPNPRVEKPFNSVALQFLVDGLVADAQRT